MNLVKLWQLLIFLPAKSSSCVLVALFRRLLLMVWTTINASAALLYPDMRWNVATTAAA
jgi:hypothetical protein